MDSQEREAREIVRALPFKEKVKYFWDYHKNHTIFAIVLIVLVAIATYQTITNETYDLVVSYYGGEVFTQEQADVLIQYLEDKIEDINEDGEKNVKITLYHVAPETTGTTRMAVNQKLTVDAAARVNAAIIFDEEYFDYAGPTSEVDAVVSGFDMRESEEIAKLLGLGEDAIYWCQGVMNSGMKNQENAQKIYDNALLAEKAIKGEL